MLVKHPSERLRVEIDMHRHPYFDGMLVSFPFRRRFNADVLPRSDWERMKARQIPPPWVPSEDHIPQAVEEEEPVVTVGRPYKKGEDPLPEFYFNPIHSVAIVVEGRPSNSEADDIRDIQNVVFINDHYRKRLAALPHLRGTQPRTDNDRSALAPPTQAVDRSVEVMPVIRHSHKTAPHRGSPNLPPHLLPSKNIAVDMISRSGSWMSKAFQSKLAKLKQSKPVARL
jgi:hypothetical protein